MLFISMIYTKAVFADNITPTVPFFPERTVYITPSDNKVHKQIQKHIFNDFKADGLKFLIGQPHNNADYILNFQYGVGCPNTGHSAECRLLILWDLFRADNAPVASWQAYYPVDIHLDRQIDRFKNYQIPQQMIERIADDFIKSLNYETLKKQEFDKVYIKPDRLNDQTTLCSADSLYQFYEDIGLYVTHTAHEARFFIATTVTPVSTTNNNKTIMLRIERMILDRLTGNHELFPIETHIESSFLENDSYDCNQSAQLTLDTIGQFINNAP